MALVKVGRIVDNSEFEENEFEQVGQVELNDRPQFLPQYDIYAFVRDGQVYQGESPEEALADAGDYSFLYVE